METKERTIDLNRARNIAIKPDYELLGSLRKQACMSPSKQQRKDIKSQFENEYLSIMHTSLKALAEQCHICSKAHGFRSDWLNVPEKLMLIITEMSEAMEAYRHIKPALLTILVNAEPQQKIALPDKMEESINRMHNFQEELADTLIRLLDLMIALNIDIEATVASKMAINELREHKHGKYR